jgi:hypothetical protein
VVDPSAPGPNRFPTLEAACAAAATGDVIELRYNDRAQEPPLAIRNLKLTIRAADGYQPVVVFRSAGLDPVKYPRAMLSLSGAQLTLVNVALEFEVPREVASGQWSLFEIRQAELVRLEKCSLTIRNNSDQLGAYHPDVAFFRVKSGPLAGSLIDSEAGAPPRRATLALVDCILRGEAVALRAQDPWPIQFSWENGLLLTTEQLLAADGGERTPSPGESIQLDLQHVTAVVRGGLCRFNQSPSGPRLLNTQVTCANSILVGGPTTSLVEHTNVPASESGRPGFAWNGDRNFYEGFASFWTIRRAGDATAPAEVMSFDAWRALWGQRENLPSVNRVQWLRAPAADRPVHALDPSDYALNSAAASANPALGAASDGRDAGCLIDRRLPQLPSSPPLPAAADKPAAIDSRGPQPKPESNQPKP